jgi:hypothetical protein
MNWQYNVLLYVQVTVHRDSLRINNQQDASSTQNFIFSRNSTCFGHLLWPSSGVISRTRGNWYVSCRLCGRCQGESGSNLTLLGRGHITCMKHTYCRAYSILTPDDGHRRCPKHAEFYDKINFGYLMHLIGCFIRNMAYCYFRAKGFTIK